MDLAYVFFGLPVFLPLLLALVDVILMVYPNYS